MICDMNRFLKPIRFAKRSLTLSGALLLAACSAEQAAAPLPPEVIAVTVSVQPVPNIVEFPGRVQAFRTSEVRARVGGVVLARMYDEGSDVPAGKSLFEIDPSELRANDNAARARLAGAQATAANARQDIRRYETLIAEQAISQQDYDTALAKVRTADAEVAQAEAQLASARLSLGYATVTAPIAGRVGRALVTEGALVSGTAGTLLTTIEQIDRVYVNFSQSSSSMLAVRRDIESGKLAVPDLSRVEVKLVLEDGASYPQVGHLDFLDLSIDLKTGTAALRAAFPNPDQFLLPGQFVRARIQVGDRPDAVLIPQRAVQMTAEGATVMVVGAENIAVIRPVKVGTPEAGQWAILEGLKPGERVIVDGLQRVRPGQPVRVADSNPTPAGN